MWITVCSPISDETTLLGANSVSLIDKKSFFVHTYLVKDLIP